MAAAIVCLVGLYELRRRRQRREKLMRRRLRDASNPFELPENTFIREFRLSVNLAKKLCEALEPQLRRQRISGIPVHIKVLTALSFYGSGSYQRHLGLDHFLALSQKSVSHCIADVTAALQTLAPTFVTWPQTRAELDKVSNRFQEIIGFPGVIGAIDCTHVTVKKPREQEEEYKHMDLYSINVQITCDYDLKITSVCARYAGSVKDQFIWNNTRVKEVMADMSTRGIGPYFLLGDAAYTAEKYLLTPLLNTEENTKEHRYTQAHFRTHSCVQRCFELLKSRWRCLHDSMKANYDPAKVGSFVNVCAMLHNLALLHKVPLIEHSVIEEEEERIPKLFQKVKMDDALQLRQHIIDQCFA